MIRILVEADLHCGHVLGLTPPGWWQKRTRSLAKPLWEWRAAELKQIGEVDFHVCPGDLVDGPGKKETIGLLTTDVGEQAEMATEALSLVRAKYRYLTYGTPFHTVSTLSHENLVASSLGCEIMETLRLKIKGKRFHFRHIVGRSDIPYGQGTQVAKEIIRDELQALAEGFESADIFGRAHAHYWYRVDTAQKTAFICPALELPNPDTDGNIYARRLRTMYYNVGNVLIEIDRTGEVYIRPRIMPLRVAVPKEYLCPLEAKKSG